MLSTTVEPECRQRPFVMSYAMTWQVSRSAADTAGSRTTIEAGAVDAPGRVMPEVLAHSIIHPEADRIEVYGGTVRAHSAAVH